MNYNQSDSGAEFISSFFVTVKKKKNNIRFPKVHFFQGLATNVIRKTTFFKLQTISLKMI